MTELTKKKEVLDEQLKNFLDEKLGSNERYKSTNYFLSILISALQVEIRQ